MKRLFCLLGALCLLTTGCGGAPADNAATTTAASATDSTATTTTTKGTTTTTAPSIPEGFLSVEKALQIAYDYWDFTPGDTISVGKEDETDRQGTGMVYLIAYPTEDAPYYEAEYSWYVPATNHRSVLDHVWIHAVTGETGTDLLS